MFIALFFALLLCAASAFATAVYLDGVKVDARVGLTATRSRTRRPPPSWRIPQKALQEAWVSGRKAGYKKGVAAGKLQAEPARKKAYQRGRDGGPRRGPRGGREDGLLQGLPGRVGQVPGRLGPGQPGDTDGDVTGPETAPTP